MDNTAGANDMTLVPFKSGHEVSSLDQDSMAQDIIILVLYESVAVADDESSWIIVYFKYSWKRGRLPKTLKWA